jgi:hypothetical protein
MINEADTIELLILYLQQRDKMTTEEKEIVLNALKMATLGKFKTKELL